MSVKTWVVLSDIQYPFHDAPVLNLILRFIEELKPYGVLLNGDITDCYEISDFDRDPQTEADIDQERALAGGLMARLAKVTQRRRWLGGNHEDRLRRFIWKHGDLLKRLGKQATQDAMRVLDFPALFRLPEYGFEWQPYGDLFHLGKLVVTHGSLVRQHSGASARSHLEKYGQSVLHGHTHRLGAYYHTNLRGVHAGFEGGCACKLTPEYVQHPNWQQGFSVVHVEDDGFFNVQLIPVLQRRCFWYGEERWDVRKGTA